LKRYRSKRSASAKFMLKKAKQSKGDTLAYIDIPEVNAKMMQAEGAITSAKGQLNMYKGATVDQLNQIDGQIDAGKAQLNFAKES
jgi:HlyD family secretion protein